MENENTYILIQKTSLSEFEKTVNDCLLKGYKLHGDTRIIISPDLKVYGEGFVYIQPMLKKNL